MDYFQLFHNMNTRLNVTKCYGQCSPWARVGCQYLHLMKGFVKDSSNSLNSNRERVALTIFFSSLNIDNQEKITTTRRKCSGKCMKPEPSEVKHRAINQNWF